MLKLRIISPRWNAELDRFQLPNEIVEVPDSELPHWAAHTELVVDEQPQPEGAVNEAAPSEPVVETTVLKGNFPGALPPFEDGPQVEREGPAVDEPRIGIPASLEGEAVLDTHPDEFACPDCDRTFDTERGLKTHSRTHRKE